MWGARRIRRKSWRVCLTRALLAVVLAHVVIGYATVYAQWRQPSLEENSAAIQELRFRVGSTEQRLNASDIHELPARVRVLESDMTEVKWLARGVLVAVVAQLVARLIELRKAETQSRRSTDREDLV